MRPARRPNWLGGIFPLALVALLPLGVAMAVVCAPPAGGPVAAAFPPWWTSARIFAAAGGAGRVVRFGGVPFIVVVVAANRPLLRAMGAWVLLDPRLLGACATRQPA